MRSRNEFLAGDFVQAIFADQAERWPGNPAVVAAGRGGLTYAELLGRARRLAHRLRLLGVVPEVMVGILAERSPELLVGILGVLEAGGAYLPLDPFHPGERLAGIVEDAHAPVLLVHRRLRHLLPRLPAHVIDLDDFGRDASPGPGDRGAAGAVRLAPPPGLDRESPAYAIYTSGTTGTPKGVVIRHGALLHSIAARFSWYPEAARRFLIVPSFAFDSSVAGIFWTLGQGGCVVLPEEGRHADPGRLAELVEAHRVTHWLSVPTLYAALLEAAGSRAAAALASLRTVIVAGEACSPSVVARHFELLPQLPLFNEYGPTEATVWATVAGLGPAPSAGPGPGSGPGSGPGPVPIGRPIPGVQLQLLDAALEPVPAGTPGEIYLAGETLARGYCNRPAQTAERFVPDPFSPRRGSRRYRTGDLARMRGDGMVEYLGRVDQQVKLRGVRIELGEVEQVLAGHPDVADAAVAVDGQRLAAYVVPRPDRSVAASDLREYLGKLLPPVMIPSVFLRLAVLPRNANGKLDRRALPPPDGPGRERESAYIAPRTDVEQRLAALWAELFGLEQVGAADAFLELGGHSLLAARLVTRIREVFGVDLSLRVVFANPTVAALATEIAERRRQTSSPGAPATATIPRVDRRGPLPLSFGQQRVWYLAQLAPESVAYHTQLTLELTGELVVAALARALQEIVQRHEILRTSFASTGGEPLLRIEETVAVGLPLIDLQALPAARRTAAAEARIVAAGRQPFDLRRPPLARWQLLRFHPDRHVLIQTEHHLVHDGWSLSVLLREMKALYEAVTGGPGSPGRAAAAQGKFGGLPPLPVQFVDVAAWQQRSLDGPRLAELLAYWRERLAGCPPPPELPADHPRPPSFRFRGAIQRRELPVPAYRALKGLSRRHGVTLFTTLLSAFLALLERYSGERDLVIGSTVANRRWRESEALIGMMVNNVVLRADLAGDPGFLGLLQRVHPLLLDAYAHEDLPFERLVEELRPRRQPDRNPLFQHLFSFHDSPMPDFNFGALEGRVTYRHNGSAKFDLDVVVIPRAEQLVGQRGAVPDERVAVTWEYCTALFEAASMHRMLGHYLLLLEAVAADPARRLSELPLLSAPEAAQLLREWNDTAGSSPGAALHQLVSAQARRTPGAIAVACGDDELSYGELDRRSDHLARRLRRRGVGREAIVGVALDGGLATPVALLAVLKAGAAYLPLDPLYPRERLDWALRDSHAALVLTRDELLARLPVSPERALCMAPGGDDGVPHDDDAGQSGIPAADSGAAGESLAYVIYTSGSSGRPKGIGVPHRAVANHCTAVAARYELGAADRVLQLASISFDVAVEEMFPAWLRGATVVLRPPGGLGSAAESVRWLARRRISVLNLPASYWHQWVAELHAAALALPPRLRLVVAGNERVAGERFLLWRQIAGGRAWFNAYGPTEATVTASLHQPGAAQSPAAGESMPIGRPIANVRIFLLDRALHPVPMRVTGELYIAGAGAARGYLGQPALTAERFLPCPWPISPGERMVRTGDLARHLADGSLAFVGRNDQQLKIRGYRIEPAEIESRLVEHPAVLEAAVAARPDAAGHDQLAAYLVPRGEALAGGALRQFLAARLPGYMVPSVYVELAALPRLPGGKLDRAALPAPVAGRLATAAAPAAPLGPRERQLAALWSQLLGIEQIGADDDFFALGGHSLLATQLLFQVRREAGTEVSLDRFLARPTIAALAAAIAEAQPHGAADDGERIQPLGGGAAWSSVDQGGELDDLIHFPLSFAQQRLWFLDRLQPGNPFYNFGRALRLAGALDTVALGQALGEIVRRHTALRTGFATSGGRPLQWVAPSPAHPLSLIDLSLLPAVRRQAAAVGIAGAELRRPFDLARPRLLRASLLRLLDEEHLLLLAAHHIAFDGWSMGILFTELEILYAARCRLPERSASTAPPGSPGPPGQPRPPELPELPLQYVDFAVWQRRRLRGELLAKQLAYWQDQLRGAPRVIELPADHPRPAVQTFRGARRQRRLPAPACAALRALGRRQGVTVFMGLLAAFQSLLGRYLDRADVVVGSPVAGRTRPELAPLIGFFVNTLVMRADLGGDPSFTALLGRVRQVALGAFAHQELPFEKLVEALQPERSLSYTPLFQILLVLQDTSGRPLVLPGLEVSPVDVDTQVAIFDLTLSLEVEPEGLVAVAQYSTDLFDPATIARLLGHYETLLAAAAAAPETALAALPLLAPPERHQLVREHGAGAAPPATRSSALAWFEAQAAAAPEATALAWAGGALSYGELDRCAERWAQALRLAGVGPEVTVGVMVERGPRQIEVVLGILRSGGAYVPVDPAYPAARVRYMLQDARAKVIVGGGPGRSPLPPLVTAGSAAAALGAAAVPARQPSRENLAYVIYTSGSTGWPKGVAMTHGALANLVAWQLGQSPPGSAARTLQLASLSFDVSFQEIFSTLAAGGTLVLTTEEIRRDPVALLRWLDAQRVTRLFVPFVALHQLAETATRRGPLPGALREIVTAGEALQATEPIRQLLARLPGCTLQNQYGPSESHVVTAYRLGADAAAWPALPPIGRPIAGVSIHLLDRGLTPVPLGVPGELHIGGVALARGYLGRPELTAERFVPDPFSGARGARLYRTGDLARRQPAGDIQFLGRADDQLKLRGFRIEPGEVEAALDGLPGVAGAAVVVREVRPGDRRLVAYLAAAAAPVPAPAPADLRRALAQRLPEHMLPSAFVVLDRLPLTPSGKLDRRALPPPPLSPPPAPAAATASAAGEDAPIARARPVREPAGRPDATAEWECAVAAIWCEVLGVDRVGRDDNFFDLGGHSLLLARVQARLAETRGIELPLVDLFRHPTVSSLARRLGDPHGTRGERAPAVAATRSQPDDSEPIAVIGMAGRFPGARDVEELWRNLCLGLEAISFFTPEELAAAGVAEAERTDPAFVPAGGVLGDADRFDAAHFGCTPREAEVMDPQQRLFLECAWTALEQAGYDPRHCPGRVGVYAGVGLNTYWMHHLIPNRTLLRALGSFQVMLLNDKDFLPSRVSYKLNLRGPSVNVQTACSTSLVAVHLACRSLLEGACDMALAGGVSIRFPERSGYRFQEGGIMAPDGHCRAFDAAAQGTVGGNGVAVVVLARLRDALAAGDPIRSVIRGSAINNDGAQKVGYAAPGVEGQAEVIAAAQEKAGVQPDDIGYVEAHGTGTALGDPIEVAALTSVFRRQTERRGFCALGSLKTNLGHLDAAAGAAGLIKAALMLERRAIPPSLHFTVPNPALELAGSPFYVPTRLTPWETAAGAHPRLAGVSSFGIGGTNAHVILEEPPPAVGGAADGSGGPQLLLLAARSAGALRQMRSDLAAHLERREADALADVAYTLQAGRHRFEYRHALVCENRDDAVAALTAGGAERLLAGRHQEGRAPLLVWMFPGQGTQAAGMCREIYRSQAVFREQVDRCAELLLPHLAGADLRHLLDTAPAAPPEPPRDGAPAASPLDETRLTQPALFVVEYALACLFRDWGLAPRALIGYSLGEYVAACLAGVFSLPDALSLVALRGALMQELSGGAMLSMALSESELAPLLGDELSLAGVNAPARTVASGPMTAIAALEQRLAALGVSCRRLRTAYGFHSAAMEPAMPALARRLAEIELAPPRIPFLSNLTGTWIQAEQATDPGYWAQHLRQAVRFGEGVSRLIEDPDHVFLEVGPGRTLSAMVRRQAGADRTVVAALANAGRQEATQLLQAVARLWLAGLEPDWRCLHGGEPRRRVVLPSYPFERQRYWVEAPAAAGGPPAGTAAAEELAATPHAAAGATAAPGPLSPAPPGVYPAEGAEPSRAAPAGDAEEVIAALWRQLLGIAGIGRHDDFFALGGDSLAATQLLARLREVYAVEVPLAGFFDAPTVAALGELIEDQILGKVSRLSAEEVRQLL
jgi:amino acid adenylation domain-containing protein